MSPRINAVVGRNGAGKSNFFLAIQFVMGNTPVDELDSMHSFRENGNVRVEIEISNEDKRVFGKGDVFSIVREHSKKSGDKYLVDNVHATKQEVQVLLEGAGISCDPGSYYIVPQGEVHRLAAASDEKRLEILVNASGADVFDKRITASERNLEKAREKAAQTSKLIHELEVMFNKMTADATRLQARRQLQKDLTAKKYLLSIIELLRTQATIDTEKSNHDTCVSRLRRLEDSLQENEELEDKYTSELADMEAKVAECQVNYDDANRKMKSLRKRLSLLAAERPVGSSGSDDALTQADLDDILNVDDILNIENNLNIQDLLTIDDERPQLESSDDEDNIQTQDLIQSQGSEFASQGSEFASQASGMSPNGTENTTVSAIKAALNKVELTHKRILRAIDEKCRHLESLKAKLQNVQLKEGRTMLQGTELTDYQQQQIEQLEKSIEEDQKQLDEEKQQILKLSAEVSKNNEDIGVLETEQESSLRELRKVEKALSDNKREQEASEQAKSSNFLEMRRAEISLTRLTKRIEQLTKAYTHGGSYSEDIQSISDVRRAAFTLDIDSDKYYGPLAEVLEISRSVSDISERLIGRRLFHHVVDSSETAKLLMEAMGNSTTVTFIPLHELSIPRQPTYELREGITPLSTWVKTTDPKFNKIRDFLVGKYMVCENLDTAINIRQELNLPAVTMEGDICDTSGMVSGGLSAGGNALGGSGEKRIDIIRQIFHIQAEIIQLEHEIEAKKEEVKRQNQQIVKCADAFNNLNLQYTRCMTLNNKHMVELRELKSSTSALQEKVHQSTQIVKDLEADLQRAEEEKAIVSDLSQFASTLNDGDRSNVDSLNGEISALTESCQKLCDAGANVFAKKLRISRKLREAMKDVASARSKGPTNVGDLQDDVDILNEEYQEAVGWRDRCRSLLQDNQVQLEQLASNQTEARSAAQNARSDTREALSHVQRCSNKLAALRLFRDRLNKEILDLGDVPEDALSEEERFRKMFHSSQNIHSVVKRKVSSLTDEVKSLEAELKSQPPLDPKLTGTYEQLERELTDLQSRMTSLLSEQDLVSTTLDTLRLQKKLKLDEAVMKITDSFSRIFTMLSGGHTGKLVLHRDPDSEEITSVGLSVSFGEHASQLSGGQRTICALAIILSIQTCDPAPFYIFDEIDSNLDAQARTRVASAIRSMAAKLKVQFICTTFYPELVAVANSCFGVSFDAGSSHIDSIDKSTALEFTSTEV